MEHALSKATVMVTLMFALGASNAAPPAGEPPGRPATADAASARRGPEPAACRDVTPHKVRFVMVEPGVRLEVVDFGGARNARTMVLLTGLGDNAHVYDGFAYQFTDHFHVIGITRRGFLPSSQPEHGYDVPTRARDDIAVLDALGITKATFVGHSLAGSELSKLGELYGHRVDKLVYLDAADLSQRFSPPRVEPPGSDSLFTTATLRSIDDYQAAAARYVALRKPDPSVCHGVAFDAHGAIVDSTTPDFVSARLLEGVAANPPTPWPSITAPRLGIFAEFTVEARQPWYWALTPAQQQAFDAAWSPIVDWHRDTIEKFARDNPVPMLRLPGAPHYVYINNENDVVRAMWSFLELPVDRN